MTKNATFPLSTSIATLVKKCSTGMDVSRVEVLRNASGWGLNIDDDLQSNFHGFSAPEKDAEKAPAFFEFIKGLNVGTMVVFTVDLETMEATVRRTADLSKTIERAKALDSVKKPRVQTPARTAGSSPKKSPFATF